MWNPVAACKRPAAGKQEKKPLENPLERGVAYTLRQFTRARVAGAGSR